MLKKVLGFGLMLIFAVAFSAQANTIWIPTESGKIDVNYAWGSDITFAIFDDSADINDPMADKLIVSDPSPIVLPGLTIYADTIGFTPNGSDWDLQSTETGNTLTLTDSFQFQLALFDGSTWIEPTYHKVADGQYAIEWPQNLTVLQVDAKPVPIPPTVLILGSGILSLVGIGYKRKK